MIKSAKQLHAIACNIAREPVIAIYTSPPLKEKSHAGVSVGEVVVDDIEDRSPVNVDRDDVANDRGLNCITVVDPGPCVRVKQREVIQWSVPPDDLGILRAIMHATEVDLIPTG